MASRPVPISASGRAQATAPSGYVPMAHPGAAGRWDRDSILRALSAWVQQTGHAPRRTDWCGEHPERAAAAQRKWMSEHPGWPSSSCVTAHFGSWSAGLEAAGLPARRLTFDSSTDDRVREARRLAARGLSLREIAFQLELSRSTVHNYLRARDCPDCGGPVTAPKAYRCAACASGEPAVPRVWTRAGVTEAIRDWRSEYGRPPSYRDWTPSRTSPGRWEAESPRWPNAAVVCDLYPGHPEPWNSALLAAAGTIHLRRWSDDAVRTALARFWVQTGRPPGPSDLRGPGWLGPHPVTLRRRYGSLERAWQALGPAPTRAEAETSPASLPAPPRR